MAFRDEILGAESGEHRRHPLHTRFCGRRIYHRLLDLGQSNTMFFRHERDSHAHCSVSGGARKLALAAASSHSTRRRVSRRHAWSGSRRLRKRAEGARHGRVRIRLVHLAKRCRLSSRRAWLFGEFAAVFLLGAVAVNGLRTTPTECTSIASMLPIPISAVSYAAVGGSTGLAQGDAVRTSETAGCRPGVDQHFRGMAANAGKPCNACSRESRRDRTRWHYVRDREVHHSGRWSPSARRRDGHSLLREPLVANLQLTELRFSAGRSHWLHGSPVSLTFEKDTFQTLGRERRSDHRLR